MTIDAAITNPHVTRKDGPNGIPAVIIHNSYGKAHISLLGANVLSWQPHQQKPVIWLSEDARIESGKSIRGGVPVCWPWFGPHSKRADFPAHGFARTQQWVITSMQTLENNSTRISFSLPHRLSNDNWWPHTSEVEYNVTLGDTLELELITRSHDSQILQITQALHTYFQVSDVRHITLRGLENKSYLDKLENFKQKQQVNPVIINEEVDRIYLDTADECIIEDIGYERSIHINKTGSHSTVVWNPWQATAEKMGDLGDKGYLNMLCVESSNAANDIITLQPGEEHRLWVEYKVQ